MPVLPEPPKRNARKSHPVPPVAPKAAPRPPIAPKSAPPIKKEKSTDCVPLV
eukprot:TRINITY_DN3055_c0_g1_i1.p4 TRINITY_DN3055_c0_g1~~TRINITY_DN3055_c0_g1_i1.p4  ORF type:complete len:52 (+),score=15.85 TRINITY_DN3055_c0_g1_i1:283-438(+)